MGSEGISGKDMLIFGILTEGMSGSVILISGMLISGMLMSGILMSGILISGILTEDTYSPIFTYPPHLERNPAPSSAPAFMLIC